MQSQASVSVTDSFFNSFYKHGARIYCMDCLKLWSTTTSKLIRSRVSPSYLQHLHCTCLMLQDVIKMPWPRSLDKKGIPAKIDCHFLRRESQLTGISVWIPHFLTAICLHLICQYNFEKVDKHKHKAQCQERQKIRQKRGVQTHWGNFAHNHLWLCGPFLSKHQKWVDSGDNNSSLVSIVSCWSQNVLGTNKKTKGAIPPPLGNHIVLWCMSQVFRLSQTVR